MSGCGSRGRGECIDGNVLGLHKHPERSTRDAPTRVRHDEGVAPAPARGRAGNSGGPADLLGHLDDARLQRLDLVGQLDDPLDAGEVDALVLGQPLHLSQQSDVMRGVAPPAAEFGRGRRYSSHDVALLREVQRLSQDEGVNLAGIKRIIELTNQVEALQQRIIEMAEEIERVHQSYRRDLVPVARNNALVVWHPRRGVAR